jgi:hypothetical protein
LWMKDMVDQVLKISGCQENSFFTVRMISQDRVSRTIPMWKNLKEGRDMLDRRLRAWLWTQEAAQLKWESLKIDFGFLTRCDVGDCGEARIFGSDGGYTGKSNLQLIAAGLRTPSKRVILAGRS